MRNFLFKKVLSRVRTRSNVLIQNIPQSVVQYHRKKIVLNIASFLCFLLTSVPLLWYYIKKYFDKVHSRFR